MYIAVNHHYATAITNIFNNMQAYDNFTWCFLMTSKHVG